MCNMHRSSILILCLGPEPLNNYQSGWKMKFRNLSLHLFDLILTILYCLTDFNSWEWLSTKMVFFSDHAMFKSYLFEQYWISFIHQRLKWLMRKGVFGLKSDLVNRKKWNWFRKPHRIKTKTFLIYTQFYFLTKKAKIKLPISKWLKLIHWTLKEKVEVINR